MSTSAIAERIYFKPHPSVTRGLGTMLQAERSRVRFSMRLLKCFQFT
jgi:hypothetical protein